MERTYRDGRIIEIGRITMLSKEFIATGREFGNFIKNVDHEKNLTDNN